MELNLSIHFFCHMFSILLTGVTLSDIVLFSTFIKFQYTSGIEFWVILYIIIFMELISIVSFGNFLLS